jgi:hypothetical protein
VVVVPTLSVAGVVPEMQHSPACPFRIVDSPISHKVKTIMVRPQVASSKRAMLSQADAKVLINAATVQVKYWEELTRLDRTGDEST